MIPLYSSPNGDVNLVPVWPNSGAPTSGTSGTLAGYAQTGDLLADYVGGNLYQNKGTQASPTWTIFEASGGAGSFTTLAASGAVSGAGFAAFLASPTGPIGSTAPVAVTGTTITANTDFSGPTVGATAGTNAAAGVVGEIDAGSVVGSGTSGTCTITIAAPAVVTYTNTFSATVPQPVVFTTNGSLPTGITASTVYYTVPSTVTGTTFEVATSVANAIAGTAITTTGTQSGTQTVTAGTALATTTAINVTGIQLQAGDYDVWGQVAFVASSATVTLLQAGLNQTSATLGSAGTYNGGSYQSFAGPAITTQSAVPALVLPACQVNLSAPATVFLVVEATFSAGTLNAYGFVAARRRR